MRPEIPPLHDPELTVTFRIELFPDDDPAHPVPEALRSAYVHPPDGRVFVPLDFVGSNKMRRALQVGRCPPGDVPVCHVEGTLCVDLDWLEESLPEYAGIWARIRSRVVGQFPAT